MKRYGLIGYPLTHSFSKKFFSEKFAKERIIDCTYDNFSIPDISELKNVLTLPGLQGFNVTIPYKEKVIPYLDQATSAVKEMNACNCIRISEGKLLGYNTDVTGFRQSLLAKWKPGENPRALILGTGGSSKAVKYVLEKLRVAMNFVSRTPKAGQLTYEQVTGEIIQSHQLIVNTTPLGMYPNVEASPSIPYSFISKEHFLFDLIYNPAKTEFLKKGEEQGAIIQNGYEMLLLQAEESWRIWNDNS
jgi:shikimate dehydrogenase